MPLRMSSSQEEHPHLHYRKNLHVATSEDCKKRKDDQNTMGRHAEETYSMQTSSKRAAGRKAASAKSSQKEESRLLLIPGLVWRELAEVTSSKLTQNPHTGSDEVIGHQYELHS